jgi:Leucine-rich repeat (LRR) protein
MLLKDDILSKCKVKSLDEVKNINLWGCDLNNIDIISEMKNLEVASLSLNKISSLKPFQNLHNLKELYLRKNNISDIKEIEYLKQCPNLKIVWIEENPLCQKDPNYQKEIIKELPQIIKLDNKKVKDILNEEKINNSTENELKNDFVNSNNSNKPNLNVKLNYK